MGWQPVSISYHQLPASNCNIECLAEATRNCNMHVCRRPPHILAATVDVM